MARWAKFFAEEPLKGLCWANFFAVGYEGACCRAKFFAGPAVEGAAGPVRGA